MMKNQGKRNQFEEQFEDSEANFSEGVRADPRQAMNQGKPIQLVRIEANGKISLNFQALDCIAGADLPVGFVSLVGKSRTGKSFLLNKLLQLSGPGFRVDPSTQACTEGIWMWSQPMYNAQLGNYLYFLDTEGTDSLVKTADNDAKIFTLATLISSYFIYNSTGAIDELSLNDIEMITALSKKIRAESNSSERDNEEKLYLHMPKFLWLLRDFTLRLEDERGRKITATQYLENCLNDQNGRGEDSKKVKKSIMNYFKNRQCMVLVRPAGEQIDLQRLNTMPDHALRREFVEGVNALREKVLKNAGPKVYNGQEISSGDFTIMLETYVQAFNSGKVPTIKTAWEQIVQNEGAAAYNKALDKYEEVFQEQFESDEPKEQQQLYRSLRRLHEETINEFQANCADKNNEYMAKLRTLLSDKEESIVKINFELSVNRNNEILQKHSRKLKEKLEGNRYNNKDEFTNDVNEIVKNYNKEAKGEKKGDIIADFLSNLTVISLAMEKSQPDTSAQTNIALQEYEAKMKLKEQENESLRRQLEADKNASNLKTKSKLPNGSSKPGASGKEDKDNRSAGCCSGDKCIIM